MSTSFVLSVLLAQDPAGGAPAQQPPSMWPLLLGIVVIFLVMMYFPQKKEQKRRAAMMNALKKHDRILLNCGLYGTIAALDEQTVTIKVDDSSNVRMRFTRSAIAGLVSGDTDEAKAATESANAAAPRS